MGTDIHIQVEILNGDDEWEPVTPPYRWVRYDGSVGNMSWSPYAESKDIDDERPDPTLRNYNLFAFLAGVRNGRGFAGVKTHEPVVPMFEGRGLPLDSRWLELSREVDDWPWPGDHSYTWALLSELLECDWELWFYSQGIVGVEQFLVWKERGGGAPDSWSGGIWGKNVTVHDDPDEFEELIESGEIDEDDHNRFCRVDWYWQPLKDCSFLRWCRQLPSQLGAEPDEIRVLMGFDS